MRTQKLIALSLLLHPLASPVALADNMQNCDLQTIPKEAKRLPTHGVDFLHYPPLIESSYTGCQITWLEDGYKLSTAYFRNGKVVWLKGQEPNSKKSFYCAFENGVLVKEKSDVAKCPENLNP